MVFRAEVGDADGVEAEASSEDTPLSTQDSRLAEATDWLREAIAEAQEAVFELIRTADETVEPVDEKGVLRAFEQLGQEVEQAATELSEADLAAQRAKVKEAIRMQDKKLNAMRGATKSSLANKEKVRKKYGIHGEIVHGEIA